MEKSPFTHQPLMLRKIGEPVCKLKNSLSAGVSWKTERQGKWSEIGLCIQSNVDLAPINGSQLEVSTRFGSIWLRNFDFLNAVSSITVSESWSDTDIHDLLNLSISLMDPEIRELLGGDVRGRWHAPQTSGVCDAFVLSLTSRHGNESHSFSLVADPEVIQKWTTSGKWIKHKRASPIDMDGMQIPGQVVIGHSILSTAELSQMEVGCAIFLDDCYLSDNAAGVIDFGGVKARAAILSQHILSIEYLSA